MYINGYCIELALVAFYEQWDTYNVLTLKTNLKVNAM